jgi:hypothetical protein
MNNVLPCCCGEGMRTGPCGATLIWFSLLSGGSARPPAVTHQYLTRGGTLICGLGCICHVSYVLMPDFEKTVYVTAMENYGCVLCRLELSWLVLQPRTCRISAILPWSSARSAAIPISAMAWKMTSSPEGMPVGMFLVSLTGWSPHREKWFFWASCCQSFMLRGIRYEHCAPILLHQFLTHVLSITWSVWPNRVCVSRMGFMNSRTVQRDLKVL